MPLHICGMLRTEFVNSRVNEFADEFAVLGAGVSSLMSWHLSGPVIIGGGGLGYLNAHEFAIRRENNSVSLYGRILAQCCSELEDRNDIFIELFVCS
jgi:hypothetical protein